MKVSYGRFWSLLEKRKISKRELSRVSGVSLYIIGKMSRDEDIFAENIAKICIAINCSVSDILEIILDEPQETLE